MLFRSDFGDFTVTRKYRGVTYHIQVSNPDHVEKGVASMTVDGTAVKGNLIPFSKEKDQVEVKVIMG